VDDADDTDDLPQVAASIDGPQDLFRQSRMTPMDAD
jgi:hypothetical protein